VTVTDDTMHPSLEAHRQRLAYHCTPSPHSVQPDLYRRPLTNGLPSPGTSPRPVLTRLWPRHHGL
jgi:hypothetical protein